MKICPRCRKELGETAIRCKYCRSLLTPKKSKTPRKWKTNLEPNSVPWSLTEVLILWGLIFLANFLIDYYQVSSQIMEFLRGRYFILIKEPALHFHIYIFISTFILKLSAVGIIWAILKVHKVNFISGLNLNIPIRKEWLWTFFAFFIFAVSIRLISDTDPLSPNLPIYLFFKESSITGNIITIFSLAIVAPITEEIFFRGFIYPGINKRLGLYWSILITSSLFMAIHIPQCREHPMVLITIFIGGIFLTAARAITKSTLLVILLHSLYNSTLTIVGFIKFLIFKC